MCGAWRKIDSYRRIARRTRESVTSLDLHKHKVKLIKEAAGRLGLANIDARAMDARKAGETLKPEQFDRILVDAPCSGFGVIRRKPDMKYSKKPEDSARLAGIQLCDFKGNRTIIENRWHIGLQHMYNGPDRK